MNRLTVAILASGGGSTFRALVTAEKKKTLNAQITGLIVDRDCKATEVAQELDVPYFNLNYKADPENFGDRLTSQLKALNPDCVLLCGFLRKIPLAVIAEFKGRIFNSHPALLPKHGGPGLYGLKVHQAVLRAGERETGVSFHHVTENYDEGPLVAQRRIAVAPNDTAEALEAKVKDLEKEFLIDQINKIKKKE